MKKLLSNAPLVLAGVFNFYDSLNVGAQALLRPLYALFGLSLAAAVFASRAGRVPVRSVLLLAGVLALGFLPTPFNATSQTVHIVGDSAVLISLVLGMLLGEAMVGKPSDFRAGLVVFFSLSFLGAIVATQFVSFGRFEPAPPFSLSVLLTFAMFAKTPKVRAFAASSAGLIAVLGFLSGFRTFSVLVLVGIAVLLYTSGGIYRLIKCAGVAVLVGILMVFAGANPLDSVLSSEAGRLGSIASGDASISARVLEAGDVLETASDEWSVANYFVGSGVGATYQPNRVTLQPNLDALGRVHNVHIGPIGVLFRHGVIGLALLALFWSRIRRSALAIRRNRGYLRYEAARSQIWLAALLMTAPLYAIDFLVRNSSVNPGFALSFGAIFALALNERPSELFREAGGSSNRDLRERVAQQRPELMERSNGGVSSERNLSNPN